MAFFKVGGRIWIRSRIQIRIRFCTNNYGSGTLLILKLFNARISTYATFEAKHTRTTQKSGVLESGFAAITVSVPFIFWGQKLCTLLLTVPCTVQTIFIPRWVIFCFWSFEHPDNLKFLPKIRLYSHNNFTSVLFASVSDSWNFCPDPDPDPYHWIMYLDPNTALFLVAFKMPTKFKIFAYYRYLP